MENKTIIDNNTIYEIDLECVNQKKKNNTKQNNLKKNNTTYVKKNASNRI